MKNYSNKNIDFPTCNVWGELYSKFRKQLMAKLSSYYCLADREDAVESAFDKLMNKKDKDAYGDKMPKTENGWFWALYWQARAYLSHMREHGDVHARYVEEMAKELENVFAPGYFVVSLIMRSTPRHLPLRLIHSGRIRISAGEIFKFTSAPPLKRFLPKFLPRNSK